MAHLQWPQNPEVELHRVVHREPTSPFGNGKLGLPFTARTASGYRSRSAWLTPAPDSEVEMYSLAHIYHAHARQHDVESSLDTKSTSSAAATEEPRTPAPVGRDPFIDDIDDTPSIEIARSGVPSPIHRKAGTGFPRGEGAAARRGSRVDRGGDVLQRITCRPGGGRMRTATTLIVLAGGAAPWAPVVAHAQQPTLQFDRGCYTEQQDMHFSGAGYTPGGQVDLMFARPNQPRGAYTTHADATGALNDFTGVGTADQFLEQDEGRETIFVAANDLTRIDADQQPPESQFGSTQFTFTRWEGYSPGRFVPGKRAAVEIYGWAFAAGKPAWFLFRKGSRTVASVKLGRLDDQCGDRSARVRVPRSLTPGAYRVVLTTDRRLRERYTWRKARVIASRAAAATASNRSQVMCRATRDM
jgi:hypothetical protein